MGQLNLIAASGLPFLCTPALTDAYLGAKKLSPSGTACTLSFYAIHTQYWHNTFGPPALNVYVWRAAQGAWEDSPVATITLVNARAWGDTGVNDTWYYKNDYSKRPTRHHSVQLTLYPGDVIRLESTYDAHNDYGFIVDDILLVKN